MRRGSSDIRLSVSFVLTCFALASEQVSGAEWREVFTDPTDQRLDASRWLLERKGFLPVPLIITEPAVGYGGGAALLFFHRNPQQSQTGSRGELTPPSISAVAAAATENGTKLAALGHLGVWRDDTLRYSGGVGAMSVHLKFYGGDEFPRFENGIEYEIEGWGTLQQLLWRRPHSRFWLGGTLIYFDATASLESEDLPATYDRLEGDVTSTAVGAVVSYDSRDNIFTPTRGLQSEWNVREYWGEFGRDFEYQQIEGKNRWYFDPDPRWVVGWRLDVNFTSGEVPFYSLPSINQRGIAKARYQGEAVVATELEVRYDIDGRWFGVAFGGVSRAMDSLDDFGSAPDRWAGGAGVRYLIARALGMHVGIDVARGPEEWTFYIQTGNGWTF